ncbi:MAG TPA: PA0069 family radical SAM protein [Thermoanaerobaculia bacterium]|jgi:DNA repair photolyase|nr:PA0069 family radical SAM protein [Thermoanaerobaculia bacterium]
MAEVALKGRGAIGNPKNRFETLVVERDEEVPGPEWIETELLRDTSKSIIAYNDSPDVGFSASVNPYRGCEHGCVYCYARPFHEYLGFSAGLDFESRILVKEDAPALLRKELSSPKWKPQTVAMSGVTDCYQPAERRLEITRRCLAVLAEFRNPVGVITKNELVTRDIDILQELNEHQAAMVMLSITTLDPEVARRMEPRASHPRDRLKAIERLAAAGIPVGVMVAPVVPAITDHEMPKILEAAAAAGARTAGYVVMRLPGAVAGLFERWLEEHFPDRKEKVLNRIRDLRGGQLYDPRFGNRMRGEGLFADQIRATFQTFKRRYGLDQPFPELSTDAFRRPGQVEQLGLFG